MYRVSRGRRENLAQNDYVVRREYEPKRDIITSSFFFPSPFRRIFSIVQFSVSSGCKYNTARFFAPISLPSLFFLSRIQCNLLLSTIINCYLIGSGFASVRKTRKSTPMSIKRSAGNSFVTERLRNGSIIVERTF